MADVELLPCPFCGSGETDIRENGRPWLGMRYGDPSSVSVRHWCEPIEGQPSRMIERVGRDRAAAITAWNTRATDANLAALQAEAEALRAEVGVLREELKELITWIPLLSEARAALSKLAAEERAERAEADAARWLYIRRKLCLIGNGDGTYRMEALNLPARIQGQPEHGKLDDFYDAAIDAAVRKEGLGDE